jgi:hypothetical protein
MPGPDAGCDLAEFLDCPRAAGIRRSCETVCVSRTGSFWDYRRSPPGRNISQNGKWDQVSIGNQICLQDSNRTPPIPQVTAGTWG